jgi:predicted dehydrogenase
MSPITFAIIGASGWRAQFFLRIARELPERFGVSGLLVRDAAKGAQLEREWNLPTYRDMDELLRDRPQFVVVSVPWPVAPGLLRELSARGVPVLCETPPAPDLEGLIALHELTKTGARIQVAEQLQFRPLHAARIALAQSGRLGQITQAQVSVAHGYHGINLLRRYLNVDFENATITARSFESPIVEGAGRGGLPQEEKIVSSSQTLAFFDFGDRLGIFDFSSRQYFASIRASRTLVRGDRGEISDSKSRYLLDFRTPIEVEFVRRDAGQEDDLRPLHHEGITLGNEWIYRNPFAPGRLSDDEIAVTTCLQKMGAYVEGGPDFYSLAQASQDHYLSLLMDQAVKSGQPVRTQAQIWTQNIP